MGKRKFLSKAEILKIIAEIGQPMGMVVDCLLQNDNAIEFIKEEELKAHKLYGKNYKLNEHGVVEEETVSDEGVDLLTGFTAIRCLYNYIVRKRKEFEDGGQLVEN